MQQPNSTMMIEEMLEMSRQRSLSSGFVAPPEDLDELGLTRHLKPRARKRYGYWGVVLLVLAAGSAVVVLFRNALLHAAIWIGRLPPAQGGTCYIVLLVAWLVALLPTSLLEIAAGFIFNFWLAALYSSIGKVTGSCISFAVGRHYKAWVRDKLVDDTKASREPSYVQGLELAMRSRPFSTCLALRLAYVPEAVQNYVPAVLDARFPDFALATMLGSSAYAMLWAKLGSELHDAKDIINDGMSPERIAFTVIGVCSLVAVLLFVHWNTKRMIKHFVEMQSEADGTSARDVVDASTGLV